LLTLGLTFAEACSTPVISVGVGFGAPAQPAMSNAARAHVAGQTLRIPTMFIAALLCRKNSQRRPVLRVT
jgi:hypothetical protein